MKRVLVAVLVALTCFAAHAETDYTVERKVDYLWRHVMGSGGGGGGDYPTKEWVNGKLAEERQIRVSGDAALETSVTAVSNRVTTLENAAGDYVTEADVYGIIKSMITDGGIVIGDYEYKLVVETVRNLSDSVLRFADGTVIVTNIVGTLPATYAGNTNLVSLDLGTGVTGIGVGALQGCTGMTNLVLSDSFTTLNRVSCNATGITTLSVPSGVTVFPQGCFANNQHLKTLYIHGYVTSFGIGAFMATSYVLTDVTFAAMTKAQVQAIPGWSNAFYGMHGFTVHCTDGDFYVP